MNTVERDIFKLITSDDDSTKVDTHGGRHACIYPSIVFYIFLPSPSLSLCIHNYFSIMNVYTGFLGEATKTRAVILGPQN